MATITLRSPISTIEHEGMILSSAASEAIGGFLLRIDCCDQSWDFDSIEEFLSFVTAIKEIEATYLAYEASTKI